jgi:hypothetical protein
MNLVKNFLDQNTFIQLKNIIFSENFPWTYNDFCTDPPAPQISQFTHVFFWNNVARETYPILKPLIDKINPKSIGKIKSNLNLRTSEIIETGEHQDTPDERFTSAVFFLNDNDGYCRIGNNKFESKENSIVFLKSNTFHTGSTCTNKSRRIVINFVYID